MAKTMDEVVEEIKSIQKHARENNDDSLVKWPMIVFRVPKGWTGPNQAYLRLLDQYHHWLLDS